MNPPAQMWLLPWSDACGRQCCLAVSDGRGWVSRLADKVEADQLDAGAEVLDHAREMFEEGHAPSEDLDFLAGHLAVVLMRRGSPRAGADVSPPPRTTAPTTAQVTGCLRQSSRISAPSLLARITVVAAPCQAPPATRARRAVAVRRVMPSLPPRWGGRPRRPPAIRARRAVAAAIRTRALPRSSTALRSRAPRPRGPSPCRVRGRRAVARAAGARSPSVFRRGVRRSRDGHGVPPGRSASLSLCPTSAPSRRVPWDFGDRSFGRAFSWTPYGSSHHGEGAVRPREGKRMAGTGSDGPARLRKEAGYTQVAFVAAFAHERFVPAHRAYAAPRRTRHHPTPAVRTAPAYGASA